MASGILSSSPPSRARTLRGAGVSLGLGIAVGLIISAESGSEHPVKILVLCSINGLSIWAAATLLFRLLGSWIAGLQGRAMTGARMVLFVISAAVAWGVMAAAAHALGVDLGPGAPFYLALTGGMAIATGSVFYSFELIRSRLEASAARVKEIEFAEKELQMARDLQSRLLPPAETSGEGYRIAARNLAARLVAGDFYDVFRLPDGTVGVAVGDVAGKGMAAALIMASVKAMLPFVAAERSAAEALRELNRRLAAELPGREFVALALACLDPASGRLELANAGLPDPYLLTAGAGPKALVVPGPRLPLGVRHEVDYHSLEVRLGPGDRLLLLSDGLPEAATAAGEPLGYGALATLIAAGDAGGGGDASPLAWIDGLIARVRGATADGLEDDWTVVVVEAGAGTGAGTAAGVAAAGRLPGSDVPGARSWNS
jgi:hypothetical protein